MSIPAAAPSMLSLLLGHWELDWGIDAAASLYLALYLWGLARVRGRWPLRRTLCFAAGVLTVLLALQSGIDRYDDRLLSVHMVQHMLLLMLAPALVLLGQPVRLALKALPSPHRASLAQLLERSRTLTRPASCLAIFTVVLVGAHLSAFYDATLRHPLLHDCEHAAFLLAGLLLWWPLLGDDPLVRRRLGGIGRILYMLAAMPPMAVIGAYLDRTTKLVYEPYAAPAHALGVNALVNQQQAGAIMWVSGGCLLAAGGIYAAMSAMADEERRLRKREAALARERLGRIA